MPLTFPRRTAFFLLRFAICIAPHDYLDWGQAMLGELSHVEGDWAALFWAVGSASVLAKHTILSAIFAGSTRPTLSASGELFEKESPMRKTSLSVIAFCVVGSLLFFVAPVFRQAFAISLAQWHQLFDVQPESFLYRPTPYSERLARKVEQNRDAEGFAFVALRDPNPDESVRLAERAVRLDPTLTWVYGVIAVQYSSFPQFDRWVADLEKYDPQNALPHFIVAEKVDSDENVLPHTFLKGFGSGREEHESPVWQSAMAAAFQSQEIDTYLDRVKNLDRKVLLRYHVDDPFQALTDEYSWWYGLPFHSAWDSSCFAKSILESGEALEANGNYQGAIDKYLAVARFGQMMGPTGDVWLHAVQQQAYKHLASLSENGASKEQALLYLALADRADQTQKSELISLHNRVMGGDVSHWNAAITKASGLLLVFSALLLLICTFVVVVRGRFFRLNSFHPSFLTLALGMGGAIGSLLGSVMLFVSYWPYAQILQRFILAGDDSRIADLTAFLSDMSMPLGAQDFLSVRKVALDFWFAVVVLCLLALLLVVWHFQRRSRVSAATLPHFHSAS